MDTDKYMADFKYEEDKERENKGEVYYVEQMMADGPDDYFWQDIAEFHGEGAFDKARDIAKKKNGMRVVQVTPRNSITVYESL